MGTHQRKADSIALRLQTITLSIRYLFLSRVSYYGTKYMCNRVDKKICLLFKLDQFTLHQAWISINHLHQFEYHSPPAVYFVCHETEMSIVVETKLLQVTTSRKRVHGKTNNWSKYCKKGDCIILSDGNNLPFYFVFGDDGSIEHRLLFGCLYLILTGFHWQIRQSRNLDFDLEKSCRWAFLLQTFECHYHW